jgi:hypothetical protein
VKKLLFLLPLAITFQFVQAQTKLYVPNGSSGIFSSNHTGGVGIGTANPGSTLSVFSQSETATSVVDFLREVNGEKTGLAIYAYPPSVTSNSYMKSVAMLYAPGNVNSRILQIATPHSEGIIRFHTGGWGNSSTERLTISSNGDVGIGFPTPEYKLYVNGPIRGTNHIAVENGGAYRVSLSGVEHGYIVGRNNASEPKFYINSNGLSYFNGGNVGIGTSNTGS